MRARHRSIDRSTALSNVLPNTVTRCGEDGQTTIPSSQLVAGDIVLVRPGESIAADGILVDGETAVDEALLTGEASPKAQIDRRPGLSRAALISTVLFSCGSRPLAAIQRSERSAA